MTLVKAISARALADVLAERTGVPVAPLFWAATDDADYDEAAGVSVALDGGAKDLRLEQRTPAGTPMARVPIDREIDALAAILRDACGSAPHRSYLDAALSSFRDGATIGDAYTQLLRTILEPLEIAVLDASHPDVARRAAPLLRKAAVNGEDIASAARRRIDEIVGALVQATGRRSARAVDGVSQRDNHEASPSTKRRRRSLTRPTRSCRRRCSSGRSSNGRSFRPRRTSQAQANSPISRRCRPSLNDSAFRRRSSCRDGRRRSSSRGFSTF